jgi:hypothetical protein
MPSSLLQVVNSLFQTLAQQPEQAMWTPFMDIELVLMISGKQT